MSVASWSSAICIVIRDGGECRAQTFLVCSRATRAVQWSHQSSEERVYIESKASAIARQCGVRLLPRNGKKYEPLTSDKRPCIHIYQRFAYLCHVL